MKEVKWSLPEEVELTLNYFELGSLIGALGIQRKELPKSLQLKLEYWFTTAYKDHPQMGRQARKEIREIKKSLQCKKCQGLDHYKCTSIKDHKKGLHKLAMWWCKLCINKNG